MLKNTSEIRKNFSRFWLLAAALLMLFASRSGGAPPLQGEESVAVQPSTVVTMAADSANEADRDLPLG